MLHASCLMTEHTRISNNHPQSLPQQHSSFAAQSSSIDTRSIVHHPSLLQQVFHALFELQMCLVLLQIILPVLLIGKLYHKGVRITCLLACQLANPPHVFPHKSERYIAGTLEDKIYLAILRTILPPTGACRHVRLLSCGVDALVAKVDQAIACLSSALAKTSTFHGAETIYILDRCRIERGLELGLC